MKPGSWPAILCVYLFGVCGGTTVTKIVPLSADFARIFGIGPAGFGWLVSLIAVPAVLLAIPSGLLADRVGPRAVLIGGAALGIIANLLYLAAGSVPMLQAARLIEGIAIVHIYTAGPALLMAMTDGGRRTSAMTVWTTYMPVGTAIGLALGGTFSASAAWRSVFIGHGIMFVIAAAVGLLLPVMRAGGRGTRPGIGGQLIDLRAAYARPALLLVALAFFLMISLGLGANVTFPEYFARIEALSMAESSNMVAAATLGMIPGSLLAGLALRRGVSHMRLFGVLACLGFVAGTASFVPGLPLSTRDVVLPVWFFISGAATAMVMAVLPLVAEPERHGAAAALLNQVASVATFINPPLWLSFASGDDWTPFAALMGGGWLIAAIALWGATRRTFTATPQAA